MKKTVINKAISESSGYIKYLYNLFFILIKGGLK